jgi:hypothetical protein
MALTEAEKVAIRRHLGLNSAAAALYPFVPTFFAVAEVLETLPAETEAEARILLDRLADIETRLATGALDRLQASKVGKIGLNADEPEALRRELRRWRVELSTLLGVPMIGGGAQMRVV